jgi:hypothetical protein
MRSLVFHITHKNNTLQQKLQTYVYHEGLHRLLKVLLEVVEGYDSKPTSILVRNPGPKFCVSVGLGP